MAENCRNCLFFEQVSGEEWPKELPYHCKHTKSLFSQAELDSGTMGRHCRIWDAFCPLNATPEQIEKMRAWDGEDYDNYFNPLITEYAKTKEFAFGCRKEKD